MQEFINTAIDMITSFGGKLILAIIVLIVGKFIIGKILKLVKKNKAFLKLEGEVQTFAMSFIKIALYVLLVISVIGILGVPMASVIAVLASAGLAIGLALQGSLSNLAGGVMLMVFRPFKLEDYVEAAGVQGVTKEITLFYTVILTTDNKRITIPNGSLMNANIINYSTEENRRVDLTFTCAKGEDTARIQEIIMEAIKNTDKVLTTPEPFARLSGGTNEAMAFIARAWCKSADYWDVYFDMTQNITEAFAKNNVKAPSVRITSAQ